MPLLCSILIPTRSRVTRCLQCINSFESNYVNRIDWNVMLRVDLDDPYLNGYRDTFRDNERVKIIEGIQGKGYGELSIMFTELAKATDAKWVMQFNDDATISGPWLTEIEKVNAPALVVCEWHKLGGSSYRHDEGGPFPILPNGFWTQAGVDRIWEPPDKWSVKTAKKAGWPTVYLKGVSFHHVRG